MLLILRILKKERVIGYDAISTTHAKFYLRTIKYLPHQIIYYPMWIPPNFLFNFITPHAPVFNTPSITVPHSRRPTCAPSPHAPS